MERRGVAAVGLALAAVGCGLIDRGTPLAEMQDKQLYFNSDNDFLSISLFAKDCPLLIAGTVTDDVNGHAMVVDPGQHGRSFGEGPCYQPSFTLMPLPQGLGRTLTFTISDHTQTLRAVIGGYHPDRPVLEPESPQPRALRGGDAVSVTFTPPAEVPDQAHVRFSELGTPRSGPSPCFFNADAPSRLGNNHVDFEVPATLCFSPADMVVCVGYTSAPHLDSCENATCNLDHSRSEACTSYAVTIGP